MGPISSIPKLGLWNNYILPTAFPTSALCIASTTETRNLVSQGYFINKSTIGVCIMEARFQWPDQTANNNYGKPYLIIIGK